MNEKVIYRCEFIFADEYGKDVFVMNFDQFKTVASVTKCVKECITPEKLGFKVIEE